MCIYISLSLYIYIYIYMWDAADVFSPLALFTSSLAFLSHMPLPQRKQTLLTGLRCQISWMRGRVNHHARPASPDAGRSHRLVHTVRWFPFMALTIYPGMRCARHDIRPKRWQQYIWRCMCCARHESPTYMYAPTHTQSAVPGALCYDMLLPPWNKASYRIIWLVGSMWHNDAMSTNSVLAAVTRSGDMKTWLE